MILMESNLVAALITGIVGPVLTYHIIGWRQKMSFEVVQAGRRKALSGRWKGSICREIGPDGTPLEAKLDYNLTASRKVIRGEGVYSLRWQGEDRKIKFTAFGGFLHDKFLRLDYKNADDSTIHFGTGLLELSADGKNLIGLYLGYGIIAERLISGTIKLEKQF